MEQWLKWAMEIQSLAQAGLAYTDNNYDRERYERLREISAEMIKEKTEISLEKVKDLFCNEEGYQTPKIVQEQQYLKIIKYYLFVKIMELGAFLVAGVMF